MAKRPQVPHATGEAIVYSARDLQVLATEHRTRRNTMRVVGTGTHPEGRFIEGQVFDLPETDDGRVNPDYQSFIDNGWAKVLDPQDDPGRTDTQIANSIVRGDALNHPEDAYKAEKFTPEQALAIVHTGDPEADASEADPHEQRGSTVGHRGTQLQALPQGTFPGGSTDARGGILADGRAARARAAAGEDEPAARKTRSTSSRKTRATTKTRSSAKTRTTGARKARSTGTGRGKSTTQASGQTVENSGEPFGPGGASGKK